MSARLLRTVTRGLGLRVVTLRLAAGGFAVAATASPLTGQLSSPCELTCGVALVTSSYAVGTAAMMAWGRHRGGVATGGRAAGIWLSGFALAAGGAVALHGDGARQERAVYASTVGLVAGGVVGLAVGARGSRDPGDLLAVSLIGSGIGTLIGGVIGAVSYERETSDPIPVFIIRIPM